MKFCDTAAIQQIENLRYEYEISGLEAFRVLSSFVIRHSDFPHGTVKISGLNLPTN